MAKKKGLPLDKVFEVARAARAASALSGETVKVELLVGDGASPDHIEVLKRAFVPETVQARVLVWDLASRAHEAPDQDCDLAVVLPGTQGGLAAEVATRAAQAGCGCILGLTTALEMPKLPEEIADLTEVACAAGADAFEAKLAEAVARHPRSVILAASFPAFRKAAADELIRSRALASAGVGAISLIPGSDLPILLAQQEELALDLMGIYGKELTPEAAADLAGVFAAGFAYRALARGVAGAIPGLGWAIKAAIAWGGTVASARAVEAHLSGSIDVSGLAGALGSRKAKTAAASAEPVIVPLGSSLPAAETEVKEEPDGYITIELG